MYIIVQSLWCCATTARPPAVSRREPAPQRTARLNRTVKIATEKVPYRQTPETAASHCTQSVRGKTVGSPLLALARLSGKEIWRASRGHPWRQESPRPPGNSVYSVYSVCVRFCAVLENAIFPKKNAKKCGFRRFSPVFIGAAKSERTLRLCREVQFLQNHDKRRRQNLQNDGGMGNETYED